MPTSVEIIRDPRSDALGFCLFVGPEHELLDRLSWPWLDWCRAVAKNSRLFVLRNRITGRFCLCSWAWSPVESTSPMFMEIEGFDASPDCWWPADLLIPELMRYRLRPIEEQREKMARRIKDKHDAKRRAKSIDHDHKKDVIARLRHMGLHQEAHSLAIGATPFAGVGTAPNAAAEWKERFAELRG